MKISFFDCNCMVGKQRDRKEGTPWSVSDLIKDMDYYGIDETLVVHALSRDYNPIVGNHAIDQITLNTERVHPVWAILPSGADESLPPVQLVEKMIARHIAAAIIYPLLHKFSLSNWSMGTLFKELNYCRIPLIIPFNQTNWEQIYHISRKYPQLPVIITCLDYRQLRYLLPLWQACSNVYIDISWFSIPSSLPYVTQKGFLGNTLFGTNYPQYDPGAAIAMVTYAEISMSDKKRIAGDNLRTLIANIRS